MLWKYHSGKITLLGTWVKSSFVVRSRPFVVSTMGSVAAQHYDISFYACYHKLYLDTFVVSTMGSATAQHYNVSFYACCRELYLYTHFFVLSTVQVKLSCGFGLVVWVFLITLYFDQIETKN